MSRICCLHLIGKIVLSTVQFASPATLFLVLIGVGFPLGLDQEPESANIDIA